MYNKKNLKLLQEEFFAYYPLGFNEPEIVKIAKKHKTETMQALVKELFQAEAFNDIAQICQNSIRIVSKASLISLFEKPKFKDAINGMSRDQKELFALGLKEMLHGDFENGFDLTLHILAEQKLAKWSLMTLIPYYFHREKEIFIKPTTTKNVLKFFEITHITYTPKPNYTFYKEYKKIITHMKQEVPTIPKDSAAFTGFLMMGIEMLKES